MPEPLHHDPRTKSQIKDLLYASLYDPIQRQFQKRIQDLVNKNCSLISSTHKSFIYKGELYNNDTIKPPVRLNRLVVQLRPMMDDYLKDIKELNDRELPYVLGFINQVLNSSNSLQDYLKLLPPSMHQPLKKMIETCPCRACSLSEDKIKAITDKNIEPISLIKQRMVKNLLI